MAAVNDILQIKAFGTYAGQAIMNVFHYRLSASGDVDTLLFALLDDWVTDFHAGVVTRLSNGLSYQLFEADNLTNGIEFAQYSQVINGNQAGDFLPSFATVSVRLNRLTKITRNGAKRFPGVADDRTTGNQLNLLPIDKAGIEAFCGQARVYPDYDGQGTSVTISPVIVGRTLNGQGVYELDLAKVNTVTGALVSQYVGTQNTRKP